MNRKKVLMSSLLFITIAIIGIGTVWIIRLYLREQDPQWQMAKEIYNIQAILQDTDENMKLESMSEVRQYEIKRPDGPSIFYYCCISGYLDEESAELIGLNKAAISLVVDVDALENCRNCKVSNSDAVMGEMYGKTYLCWTLSPKYSCVLEYIYKSVTDESAILIASSVKEHEN